MALEAYDTIFQQFPATSAEAWKEKIIKDLKGEAFDKLIWHTQEGIEVLPFYTKESNAQYQLSIPEKPHKGWQITEHIVVDDVRKANEQALAALQHGVQAILFDLQHQTIDKAAVIQLTENILTDVAPVFFQNYTAENKKMLEEAVHGSCPSTTSADTENSITDELVSALIRSDVTTTHVRFRTGQNYFFEIAKLRAFRWLWKQYRQLNSFSETVYIIAESGTSKREEQDEYTNMLRNTTEAMSAILGGCDSLVIHSHDIRKGDTDFGQRIARNIHHILQHESYFLEIQDIAKGSYYIEYLTHQLAKKAWEKLSGIR